MLHNLIHNIDILNDIDKSPTSEQVYRITVHCTKVQSVERNFSVNLVLTENLSADIILTKKFLHISFSKLNFYGYEFNRKFSEYVILSENFLSKFKPQKIFYPSSKYSQRKFPVIQISIEDVLLK